MQSSTTVAPHAPPATARASGRQSVADDDGANNLGESLGVRARLDSVDLLRGLVMVVMALDHVRDYFHSGSFLFDPLDLRQTTPALFFTRWITHFCAPIFVFLAGTGAFLSTARGKTRGELARFLLTRGLWLILLEVTLIRFGWFFNFDYNFTLLQVIWALGCSMIALAGLIYLPPWVVGAFGVTLIATHNLFDAVRAESLGSFAWLWSILHQPNFLQPRAGVGVFAAYPLVPWVGVMAAGYAFGKLLLLEPDRRRRLLWRLGVGLTLLFVVLRVTNLYGDPRPWGVQGSALYTLLSFVNCAKYPPSLLFLLMTLGPAIILLALFDRGAGGKLARPFVVFGRVPMFYYVLHIFLIHALAGAFAFARYGDAVWDFLTPPTDGGTQRPQGYGYGLPAVYLVWLAVVLLLYPACRWFAGVKRRNRSQWLSYL